MLKPQPLAAAFALTTIAFYLFLFILKITAPPFFRLVLNSQFLGADIASQVPPINLANFLGILIALGILSWFAGYLIALLYNRFNK